MVDPLAGPAPDVDCLGAQPLNADLCYLGAVSSSPRAARHFGGLPCVTCIEVIGEPSRYFAETAFALTARVIGRRTRGDVREYWIDTAAI